MDDGFPSGGGGVAGHPGWTAPAQGVSHDDFLGADIVFTTMSNGRTDEATLDLFRATCGQRGGESVSLLVDKATLAKLLSCSIRKIDTLIAQKRIPVIRLGARCHRFDVADVLAALKN